MYHDRSKEYIENHEVLNPIEVDLYKEFVGDNFIEDIKKLSKPLEGKVWSNVNSTFTGGGVAEMLQSVLPFAKGLGIDCQWHVIEGSDKFFCVTKKFHNMLQGIKGDGITINELFYSYLDTIQENMETGKIFGNMVIIHDPQPAAGIMSGSIYGNVLWRCHIDTTEASNVIWRFLAPYINQYDGAIFTEKGFVQEGLRIPIYIVSPSIDL